MTVTTQRTCQTENPVYDPSLCQTQQFFDRDVELILCEENRQCPYKRFYNKKALCTCPAAAVGR